MNRQIKFRGKFIGEDGHNSYIGDKKVGDWIYGGYMRGDLNFVDGEGDFIVTGGGHAYRVDSNSVAQLIATDRNGYEVYEGDPIKLADGWRCTATFRHFGAIVDGDATLITEE